MMKYTVTKEIKSEAKLARGLYAGDFFFLLVYAGGTLLLSSVVYPALKIWFIIFSLLMGLVLTSPSRMNRKRKMYQSVALFFLRDRCIYKPEINISYKGAKHE